MRRRNRSYQNSPVEESLINLTPLIDVVFVVLIMFILIAPMLELDRIALADSQPGKPPAAKLEANESTPVQITVDAEDQIKLNGRVIPLTQLREELLSLSRQFPRSVPKLYPDRHSHFETYQNVKNAVEASGFEEMDVVLKSR